MNHEIFTIFQPIRLFLKTKKKAKKEKKKKEKKNRACKTFLIGKKIKKIRIWLSDPVSKMIFTKHFGQQ